MALTTAQLPTLKTEIDTDPNGYGLVALRNAGNQQGIADALNLPRAAIPMRRDDVAGWELQEAIDLADLQPSANALNNPLAAAYLQSVLIATRNRIQTDAGVATRIKTNVDALVRNTAGSQARVNALATRPGSRAEQLFGRDTRIDNTDVSRALALV